MEYLDPVYARVSLSTVNNISNQIVLYIQAKDLIHVQVFYWEVYNCRVLLFEKLVFGETFDVNKKIVRQLLYHILLNLYWLFAIFVFYSSLGLGLAIIFF